MKNILIYPPLQKLIKEGSSMQKEKPRNKPFAKLYIWIRNFDVYKGHNPLKLLLHHIACRMWDFQEDRDFDMYFLNKRKTQINYISFPRYLLMSLFYKTEYTSQWCQRLAAYIPTKYLSQGLRIEIVMYNTNDARGTPHLSLFPYKHKDREGWENKYDLITCVKLTDYRPETIDEIVPLEGNPEVPLEYKNAVLQWANEGDNWETAISSWQHCKKRFIKEVDMNTITNEQIIELFPSKAVRDYLTKINWQFSERDKELLYRYLKLKEEPAYYDDYVPIPYPFRSGDIIKEIGKEELGIISRYKDDDSFYEEFNRMKTYDCLDWTDTGCTRIDFLSENGKFYHNHINAIYLEYAEIPTEIAKDTPEAYYRSCIRIASNLIRGTENSIEDLQMVCERYAKENLKK